MQALIGTYFKCLSCEAGVPVFYRGSNGLLQRTRLSKCNQERAFPFLPRSVGVRQDTSTSAGGEGEKHNYPCGLPGARWSVRRVGGATCEEDL